MQRSQTAHPSELRLQPPDDLGKPNRGVHEEQRRRSGSGAASDAASILVKMLYPFIPHAAAELWEVLGGSEEGLVFGWPDLEMDFQCSRNIEIVVQINGKKRAMISVSSSASREEIEKAAIANPRIQQLISDSEVHKIVVVPGEVVNIVAG